MPHDVNGCKLEVDNTVLLVCKVLSIDSPKEDGCNVTLRVEDITDGNDKEMYLPAIVCNSRLTQKLPAPTDEEIRVMEEDNETLEEFVKSLYDRQKEHEQGCNYNSNLFIDCPLCGPVKYEEYDLRVKDENICSKCNCNRCGYAYICCECNG